MEMKYYDLLSTTIIGVAVVAVFNFLFFKNIAIEGVAYLALGYLTGYFINALGSLFEDTYYKTIGGMPSEKLLTLVKGQNWTGSKRVKFYEANRTIELLKNELGDQQASEQKMFACAMRKVNGCEDCRVPTFNAQFAWSRTVLTAVLIADVVCFFKFYDKWLFWLIALLFLALSWNRFKERGYYYAREVLVEYLSRTEKEFPKVKG